jgi:hypothetical protein
MGWMPSKHVTAPSRSAAQHRPHGPHAGADAVTLRAEVVMQRCESGSLVLWASAGCQQAQNSKICAATAPRQPNPAAAPNGGPARAYQELSTPAIPTTAEQEGGPAVCLFIAGAGRECALLPPGGRSSPASSYGLVAAGMRRG